MKIAIDCRYLGLSGIGRFLESILDEFDFKNNEYVLIGKKEYISKYKNCTYIYDDYSPFSIKGLFKFNKKEVNKCDVFFTPNFIIPFGIKIRVISMLHDIIFLDHKEWNKNIIDTFEKKFLLKKGLKKSDKVFTVSKFSKDRIIHHFKKYSHKIEYHYPGVSSKFYNSFDNSQKEDYIIYVGNVKKSKGLITLLKAMDYIKDSNLKLVIVGDNKSFRNADKTVDKYLIRDNINFTGKIDDNELINLVKHAKFLIQPSFYEGFGSTPIEAINLGTRPIISNIEVFKEVYSNTCAIFFDVFDYKDLANKIINSDYRFEFDSSINEKYSYKNYAKVIYNELTRLEK